VKLGPFAAAAVAGIVGGIVFGAVVLLVATPGDGIRYWAPVALATAVALGAALGTQVFTATQHRHEPTPTGEPEVVALSFSAAPPGGLMPTAEAMIRFDEELRLAAEYGRPLCVALVGLDPEPGMDQEDAMEALRQLTAGALRRQDVVTERGPAELLLMLLETSYSAGWVVVERVHQRVGSAGAGTVRCVMLQPKPEETLREVLDELDGGLEACRETGLRFADPARLLAPA